MSVCICLTLTLNPNLLHLTLKHTLLFFSQAGGGSVQYAVDRVFRPFQAHPNVIHNPKGPREDSGYVSDEDVALNCARSIFQLLKKHYPKTKLILSGVNSRQEALRVAGVDYLLVPPNVVSEVRTERR